MDIANKSKDTTSKANRARKHVKGTSYTTGRVYWKKERVAEWDWAKGELILKGSGKGFVELRAVTRVGASQCEGHWCFATWGTGVYQGSIPV